MIRVSNTSRSLTVKSFRTTGSERRVACRLKVGNRATEMRAVGQHRQAARSPCLVGLGQHDRIEIGKQVAFRRRASLDLGDHRQVGLGTQALPRNLDGAGIAIASAISASIGR